MTKPKQKKNVTWNSRAAYISLASTDFQALNIKRKSGTTKGDQKPPGRTKKQGGGAIT